MALRRVTHRASSRDTEVFEAQEARSKEKASDCDAGVPFWVWKQPLVQVKRAPMAGSGVAMRRPLFFSNEISRGAER